MDWNEGFTASYYAVEINPNTWQESGVIEIIDGNIKRERSDLLESADFTTREYDGAERFIRLYLDTKQNGASEHTALFTGLTSSPVRDINGRVETSRVDCFSVLKPCQDVLLQRGYYVPASLPLNNVFRKLASYTPAPKEIEGELPALSSAIIAEEDETALTMMWKIIKAVDWRMRVTGEGTIEVAPPTGQAVATFDAIENDAIEPEINVTRDWYACPNVFRAVSEDLTAVARDDSQESPLSTINRGREIWAQESSIELGDNESIGSYAQRRLRELQNYSTKVSYNRRYNPGVLPGDLVNLHYPEQDIDGPFTVSSQSITLGHGARTQEEVIVEGSDEDELNE